METKNDECAGPYVISRSQMGNCLKKLNAYRRLGGIKLKLMVLVIQYYFVCYNIVVIFDKCYDILLNVVSIVYLIYIFFPDCLTLFCS